MNEHDRLEIAMACIEIVFDVIIFVIAYSVWWGLMEIVGLLWNWVKFDYNSNFWSYFWIWGVCCAIQSFRYYSLIKKNVKID